MTVYFFCNQKKTLKFYAQRMMASSVSVHKQEGLERGLPVGHPWPGPGLTGAPQVTSEVSAKMTKFKSEMTWAPKGCASSLKKHFALPELGFTGPTINSAPVLQRVCTSWALPKRQAGFLMQV